MRTIYLDCGMGAAGDMLTAALLELLPDEDAKAALDELNALGIPGVTFEREAAEKCGICGTHVTVRVNGRVEGESQHEACGEDAGPHEHTHHHHHHADTPHEHSHEHAHAHAHEHEHAHHHHAGMHDVEHIVHDLPLPAHVRKNVLAVYGLIADAESHVHGVPVEEIHFHEVGTMDAIADVTAVCLLMERLAPEQVIVSPVNVGSGTVRCAHGILPVPAPATAYLLRGIPIYGGEVAGGTKNAGDAPGELCTPTGAALLRHFATSFGPMPPLCATAIGYGMGTKDFSQANCVRAFLGQTGTTDDVVVELRCTLDDMTPEAIGFAEERLFAAGALEVYTTPVQMKKSRPGTKLTVMCCEGMRDKMIDLIFRHTTTLGVRETVSSRHTLERHVETVSTELGDVRRKASCGHGVTREKYEYDDLARIAREHGLSLDEVRRRLP